MTSTSDLEERRAQIVELGTTLLGATPWNEVATRALLMLVRPPLAEWVQTDAAPMLWIILDGPEARALPPELRNALVRDGSTLLHLRAGEPATDVQLAAFTSDGIGRLMEGTTRRSLEMRWLARHGQPLHDPLHRFESLAGAAARLPVDALERVVRPLYVQAAQSLEALAGTVTDADGDGAALLPAAEAAGALCRLACVLEQGSHPPAEWLLGAAAQTALGKRAASWLDDVPRALAGDARAARWIRESGGGVLREASAALRAEFAGRDWLDDPIAQTIRPMR